MKERIKKIFKFLLNNWVRFAEIAVVTWTINGMWNTVTIMRLPKELKIFYAAVADKRVNIFWLPLVFYFLSAVLILYLLRKYEKRN